MTQCTKTLPHDTTSFTEGLEIYNGVLYESTGLFGQSTLRKIDLETGKVIKTYYLPKDYFGEGITIFKDKIYMLTWKNNMILVFNLDLDLLQQVHFNNTVIKELWGLNHTNLYLIVSDGTSNLYYLDPATNYKIVKTLKVTQQNANRETSPVVNLNELEYYPEKKLIFANVFMTNTIIVVDETTGKVISQINCDELAKSEKKLNTEQKSNSDTKPNSDRNRDKTKTKPDTQPSDDQKVLNGIALQTTQNGTELYITGKCWNKIYILDLYALSNLSI